MKHTFFLGASGAGVGLTSVCLGVVRALDRRGIRVGFCKPISQNHSITGECDPSALFIGTTMGKTPPEPIPIQQADDYVREEHIDDLMERVVEKISIAAEDADVVIVEGLLPAEGHTFNNRLNRLMASSLDAEVILVTTLGEESPQEFERKVASTTLSSSAASSTRSARRARNPRPAWFPSWTLRAMATARK